MNGKSIKRILVITGHYPSPYKPYYDTQFSEFLRAGYEIRILASPALDDTINEKVIANRLLERTHYYPVEGRSTPLATMASAFARPAETTRFLATVPAASMRRKAVNLIRMLSLPSFSPDVILVHELGVALHFDWLRKWYGNVPIGLYYHGGEVPSVRPHEKAAVVDAFRSFDLVFTNTESSRQNAIDRGCPPDKIRILPVGFDLQDYQPAIRREYRPKNVLQLLSAGRMSEEKGFNYALEALRMVVESGRRNILYSFTADGYVRSQLEQYVTDHGLEPYVRFLGTLTTAEVQSAMARADALILSSVTLGNWAENQACAVQEAMLMKAIVITTQTGGVPESIPPCLKQFSVPERDAPALARAMMAVYDLAEEEMISLGDDARAFVAARYDIQRLNQEMLAALWD